MLLFTLLAFPLASLVSSAVSIAGYHSRTMAGNLHVVDVTNLRGLAVPTEPDGLIASFASGRGDARLLHVKHRTESRSWIVVSRAPNPGDRREAAR